MSDVVRPHRRRTRDVCKIVTGRAGGGGGRRYRGENIDEAAQTKPVCCKVQQFDWCRPTETRHDSISRELRGQDLLSCLDLLVGSSNLGEYLFKCIFHDIIV